MEIGVAVLLAASEARLLTVAMAVATVLLACFTLWLAWLLWLRRDGGPVKCGCFGVSDSAVSLAIVIRNGGFLALSGTGAVLSFTTTSGFGSVSFPRVMAVTVALMLLAQAAAYRFGSRGLMLSLRSSIAQRDVDPSPSSERRQP